MSGCSIFICTIFYWLCFLSYFDSINLLNLDCHTDFNDSFFNVGMLSFFFLNVLFSPLKLWNRVIVHSSDSACNCGICVWNSHCSCGFSVYSPNNFFFLCCGRRISAVSLANPAIAVLCLEHNWSCIYHCKHGGWFILFNYFEYQTQRNCCKTVWCRYRMSISATMTWLSKFGCLQRHCNGCQGEMD